MVYFITRTSWVFVHLLLALHRGVCVGGRQGWLDLFQGKGVFRREPFKSHGAVFWGGEGAVEGHSVLNTENVRGSQMRDLEEEGEGLPFSVVFFVVFNHLPNQMNR